MKHLPLIIAVLVCAFGFSQDREAMRDRIKAQKVAFITEKLELTVEESKGFWPIYNRFEETSESIKRNDFRKIKQAMRAPNTLSDKEANELLKDFMKAEKTLHDAKIKMLNDLTKVISAEKILRLRAAEDEFNRKLLERLREFRNNKRDKN